jgi:succinate-acetate transporter protein
VGPLSSDFIRTCVTECFLSSSTYQERPVRTFYEFNGIYSLFFVLNGGSTITNAREEVKMQNEGKQGLNEFLTETKERFAKAGTGSVCDLEGCHDVFPDMGPQVSKSEIAVCDTTSNPAPLGLCAFGMTTVLLNLHNAGYYPLDTMILAMGVFYGGIAQVIVGIMEWKKKNTFGTLAFTSYGLFWLTLVGLLVMPKLGWGDGPKDAGMIAYLVMWGIFTGVLFIGTFKLNRALQFVFATLTVLFFLLAYEHSMGSAMNPGLKNMIGYEGIICGLSAIYTGMAQVLNELYGKTVLPLGPMKK